MLSTVCRLCHYPRRLSRIKYGDTGIIGTIWIRLRVKSKGKAFGNCSYQRWTLPGTSSSLTCASNIGNHWCSSVRPVLESRSIPKTNWWMNCRPRDTLHPSLISQHKPVPIRHRWYILCFLIQYRIEVVVIQLKVMVVFNASMAGSYHFWISSPAWVGCLVCFKSELK